MIHKIFLLMLFLFLFGACKKEDVPKVLPPDDSPIDTVDIYHCDTIPVPNSIFSDSVGEILVFTDSTGILRDTLICVINKVKTQYEVTHMISACFDYYSTKYVSIGVPQMDSIKVELSQTWGGPYPDFWAFANGFGFYDHGWGPERLDSISINGMQFMNVVVYTCQPDYHPCDNFQDLVFANGVGFIAYRRTNTWWVRKS